MQKQSLAAAAVLLGESLSDVNQRLAGDYTLPRMKDAIPYASLQICCARRAAPRHRTNAERETQYQRHGAKHGKKQYANRYPKFFFSRAHTARPLALTTTYSAAGSFGWAACLAGISWNVFDGGRRSAWSR
ncbi:hypothetical protein OH492_26150 [Vibrio chagasii]|nr:hypothetical protein [Vibrio chagasii]